jgi:response regulator RpfG family c-di-GMP phosphodiesterase
MKYKILVVDDESANIRLLERLFSSDYLVKSATSGKEALTLMADHEFAAIISDQRMPEMTGIEFLTHASEINPLAVKIILTGYTDAEALIDAINSGVVYRYITKPWINYELKQTVKRALQHYQTLLAQRMLQQDSVLLRNEIGELEVSFDQFVKSTVNLIDLNSFVRASRISRFATEIAVNLELARQEIDDLILAIFLRELLLAQPQGPDPSSADPKSAETSVNNFERGMRLMNRIPYFSKILPIICHMSERYDGTGDPDRLRSGSIPICSRILAAVAAYEELTEPRDEDPSLSHMEAIEKLRSEAGSRFAPKVIEALFDINVGRALTPSRNRSAELVTSEV